MSITSLLNIPKDPTAWEYFAFNNYDSHQRIVQAILAQKNIRLNIYSIWPIPPNDITGWLQDHAQMHNEMDAALGVQGEDLQDVNLKDESQLISWIYLNYQEHNTAHQILRI